VARVAGRAIRSGSERPTALAPRFILGARTWSPRLDPDDAIGCGAPHRGRRARAIGGATGGGRSPRESRYRDWRRSASTTPAESTRTRIARMTCSGSEVQAAHRRPSRGSSDARSCRSVPVSRC
jgi:hypothetical protein